MYEPSTSGPFAWLQANHASRFYLNKRNTAPWDSYATLDAGIGYRLERWEVRFDGWNLTERRDPVAESELGDAQYYLMPARSLWLSLSCRFE